MLRTSDKRECLLEAAKALIHRQGFNQTTLSDIAQESGVPLGNVYYYFKTKDEIAAAVIEQHIEHFRAMVREWEEKESDPRKRLACFIKRVTGVRDDIVSHGCPVGSLCQELNKGRTPLAEKADAIIKTQVKWVTEQFRQLGKRDASDLGLELIAKMQGISLLANALGDPTVLTRQMQRVFNWLREV